MGEVFFIIFSALSATFLACLPVALIIWLLVRKRSSRSAVSDSEEDRLRHIWNGMQRLEQRIENLETILAGKRRSDPLDDAVRSEDVRTGRFGR